MIICLSISLQNGISSLCHDIRVSMATIDDKLLPGDSLLDNSSQQSGGKKSKKHKDTSEVAQQQFEVQLFTQLVSIKFLLFIKGPSPKSCFPMWVLCGGGGGGLVIIFWIFFQKCNTL